jgi:hypothetical protein
MGVPIINDRRPPGRREVRRPRGHAMPPTKRTRITAALPVARTAATFLREQGEPGMAEAVETTIEWAERAEKAAALQADIDSRLDPNYSLHVDKEFRAYVQEAAKASAEAEGRDPRKELTRVVTEELEAFRDGRWTPPAPVRSAYGSSPGKVNLNVRIRQDLFDQVDAMAKDPEQVAARGYALNARHVAIAALADRFGVELQQPSRGWDARYKLVLEVPESFRDFVHAAEGEGRDPSIVLRDYFAAFLAGEWTPREPQRAPRGNGTTKVRMSVQVNKEVRDQVQQLGVDPDRVSERGYKLSVTQVALAALSAEYDVPETLLYPWAE